MISTIFDLWQKNLFLSILAVCVPRVYLNFTTVQTLVNTLTWYCYSKKIRDSPIIRGRKPCRSKGYNSLLIKFELLLQNWAFTILASYTKQYSCKHGGMRVTSNQGRIRHLCKHKFGISISSSIWLRHYRCMIHLDDELRIGTQLRRNLLLSHIKCGTNMCHFIWETLNCPHRCKLSIYCVVKLGFE